MNFAKSLIILAVLLVAVFAADHSEGEQNLAKTNGGNKDDAIDYDDSSESDEMAKRLDYRYGKRMDYRYGKRSAMPYRFGKRSESNDEFVVVMSPREYYKYISGEGGLKALKRLDYRYGK